MTVWINIQPIKTAAKQKVAIQASSNGAGGRFAQWLAISIRTEVLDTSWLALGKSVTVQIAQDALGLVRVLPNGPFVLGKAGGRGRRIALRVPALQGQSRLAFSGKVCGFVVDPDGLGIVITLPLAMFESSIAGSAQAAAQPFKMGAPSHASLLAKKGGRK